MRAVILIAIAVIVLVIVAVATGFLDIRQRQPAQAPQLGATNNAVTAQGGKIPAFEVETGSVRVGSQNTNVALPTLEVSRPADDAAAAATNNAI